MNNISSMKAVLGYHYATGNWHCLDIMAGQLSVGADTYDRCQIESIYTKFVEAPIKSVKIGQVRIDDDWEFPDVVALEDSIKDCQKVLRSYKFSNVG